MSVVPAKAGTQYSACYSAFARASRRPWQSDLLCTLDDRRPEPGRLCNGMSKIDEYRRGRDFCRANAAKAYCRELAAMWKIVEESYVFLIELESQPRDRLGLPGPTIES